MLGIVVTSYQPHFFLYQDLLLSNLDRNKFKPIFLCSHENHEFVEMIGKNINTELQYLDINPVISAIILFMVMALAIKIKIKISVVETAYGLIKKQMKLFILIK